MTDRPGLEELLLGGRRAMTRRGVTERVGVPVELADRMWRALGFADVDDDVAWFTEADAHALEDAVALLRAGLVDEPSLLAMTRALGQTMSRLAEWQVDTLTELALRRDEDVTAELAIGAAGELLPVMERLMGHVWRRHLVAVAGRALAASSDELVARTLGVGFADLVGFTGLTRRMTESDLAGLVDRFEGTAADIVASRHGRIVKTVGDEVLFVTDTAVDLAEVGLALAAFIGDEDDLPPVRVGLAYGQLVTRLGDVYGVPVNLAARLTSLARPGTVLVDRELATELGHYGGYETRRIRRHSVRGFERLEPSVLRHAGSG